MRSEKSLRRSKGTCTGIWFRGKKTVEEYCRILYEFIQKKQCLAETENDRSEKFKESGDKAMEKEYNQIYGICDGPAG